MKNQYTAQINFRDRNIPAIKEEADTLESAQTALSIFLRTYAGVMIGVIIEPDGSRNVYNPAGEYLFTIPKIGG